MPFSSSGRVSGVVVQTDATRSVTSGTTLAAVVNNVPKTLEANVVVTVDAGTFVGAEVAGFLGGGSNFGFNLNGTFSAITPTTGVATGTAGSGTNTTTLVKPTAAANWTASDLLGKFVKITGGGGAGSDATNYPVIRPIIANTTTSLTVSRAVTGMDDTTTFALVNPGTTLSEMSANTQCLTVAYNQCPITIRGFKFTGSSLENLIKSFGNNSVTFNGCLIDVATTGQGIYCDADDEVVLSDCTIKSAADVKIENVGDTVYINGCYMTGAAPIFLQYCGNVLVEKLTSVSATSYALSAIDIGSMRAECSATTGAVTPFYFESIRSFEATGTNKLTGANASAAYGIQIEKGGLYDLEGCDVAGAANGVLVGGNAVTWANLNSGSYGSAEANGISIICNPAGSKALVYGNKLYFGSMDVSGRLLLYGYHNMSSNLSPATLTGTDNYNMESQGVRGVAEIICNSASATVTLPSGCAIAGVLVGIVNRGSQTVTVLPPGSGTINGGASTTIASNATKMFVSLNGNGGSDFWTLT